MRALDRSSRTVVFSSSAVCLIGAVAGSPLGARPAGAASPVTTIPRVAYATPAPIAPPHAIRPQRDPFVGTRDEDGIAPLASTKSAIVSAVPTIPALSPMIEGALPPNAGAGDSVAVAAVPPSPLAAKTAVRAVIVGPHPYAIVDDGSTTRLIGLGGEIDGKRVLAISLAGVVLGDGQRLAISRGISDASPSPSSTPSSAVTSDANTPPSGAVATPPPNGPPQTLGPASYQPYTNIPTPAQAGVPLQPLPEQFGYGVPSYGQPGYRPPAPAPSASPAGPTFGQTF